MFVLLKYCLLLCLSLVCSGNVITIDSTRKLQEKLCSSSFKLSNVVLNLTVDQEVKDAECEIKDVFNIMITGWKFTKISCIGKVDFLFTNVSHLKVSNLEFVNCSRMLGTAGAEYFNNTVPYFTPDQEAGIVLNHCEGPTLSHIHILNSSGYGILLLNLYGEVLIQHLSVKHTNGSGALFYFTETEHVNNANVSIVHSVFSENLMPNGDLDLQNLDDVLHSNISFPTVAAGGLTMILSSLINAHIGITIQDVDISRNQGLYGGGCLMLLIQVFKHSTISFSNCKFVGNKIHQNSRMGSSLAVYEHDLETRMHCSSNLDKITAQNMKYNDWIVASITNSTFNGGTHHLTSSGYTNVAEYGGAVYVSISSQWSVAIEMNSVSFEDNYVHNEGACIYAKCKNSNIFSKPLCQLYLTNITSRNNGDFMERESPSYATAGLFTFVDFLLVKVQGTGNGAEITNSIGSVIKLYKTNLIFSGNLYFGNNKGSFGAVVNAESSFLYLEDSLSAVFINNQAAIGGGVFFTRGSTNLSPDHYCFFQYTHSLSQHSLATGSLNIAMTFTNNTAEKYGKSMYVTPLYNCTVIRAIPNSYSLEQIYHKIFLFTNDSVNNYENSVWSSPISIRSFKNNCSIQHIYPGETFTEWLSAFDAAGNMVHAQVQFELSKSERVLEPPKYPMPDELVGRVSTLWGHNYTEFNFKIESKDEIHGEKVYLLARLVGSTVYYCVSKIWLKHCPLGFSQISGECQCHELIKENVKGCEIIEGTGKINITRPMWIGLKTNSRSTLAKSSVCPREFCKLGSTISSDSEMNIDICRRNREGQLCGKCANNASVVFGSNECMKCNNSVHIASCLIVPIGGIALVLVLILLNMTISRGLVNGFIFYVNAAIVSNLYFIDADCLYGKILTRIVQLFNLNSPLECCIENWKMDTATKTGLQFLFPPYLWLLVCIVIFLSWLSRRFADIINNCSVQVFATIVYLSYSKLLCNSFYSLVPAKIEFSDNETGSGMFWFYDGVQQYFNGSHRILGIFSLVVLIFIILPYTLLLTIGSKMMQCCNFIYLNYFVDAHHGPYRDKWRFWFGFRLWLLIYMFVVHTSLFSLPNERGHELITLLQVLALVLFIVAQAYVQPFRNKWINIIDLHFMMNNCLNSIIALYLDMGNDDHKDNLNYVTLALITESLLAFLAIVLFHAYEAVRRVRLFHRCLSCMRCFYRCLNCIQCRIGYEPITLTQPVPSEQQPSTTDLRVDSNSNERYRESMFRHDDN